MATKLRADLYRLERLLAGQNREVAASESAVEHGDPDVAIRGAIKQARRAGDLRTAQRLERKRAAPIKRKKSPTR